MATLQQCFFIGALPPGQGIPFGRNVRFLIAKVVQNLYAAVVGFWADLAIANIEVS